MEKNNRIVEIKEEILGLIRNDDNLTMEIISELNGQNGCLENYSFYENDEEFFEIFFYNKPMEAVRSSFYGDYRFNDDYVRFNAYENLESFNYISDIVDYEEVLEAIIDNSQYISDEGICDLLEEIEELENSDNEE